MNSEKKLVRGLLFLLAVLVVSWVTYILIDINKPVPTQSKINEILNSNPNLKDQKYVYEAQNLVVNKSLIYDENNNVKYDVQHSEIIKDKNATAEFNEFLTKELEDFSKSIESNEGITHQYTQDNNKIRETLIYDFDKLNIKETILKRLYAYPENPEDGLKLEVLEKVLLQEGYKKK